MFFFAVLMLSVLCYFTLLRSRHRFISYSIVVVVGGGVPFFWSVSRVQKCQVQFNNIKRSEQTKRESWKKVAIVLPPSTSL